MDTMIDSVFITAKISSIAIASFSNALAVEAGSRQDVDRDRIKVALETALVKQGADIDRIAKIERKGDAAEVTIDARDTPIAVSISEILAQAGMGAAVSAAGLTTRATPTVISYRELSGWR